MIHELGITVQLLVYLLLLVIFPCGNVTKIFVLFFSFSKYIVHSLDNHGAKVRPRITFKAIVMS